LLKLKENPSMCQAIIDKQADTADTLMIIWDIIYQQLPSLEADAQKMDHLRKSAGYLLIPLFFFFKSSFLMYVYHQ
jgi:hypothetical protein